MKTWNQRILAARKRGHFLYRDIVAAESWNRCAISENPKIQHIADKPDFSPVSALADKLGMDFYDAVYAGNFDRALKLLRRIRKL